MTSFWPFNSVQFSFVAWYVFFFCWILLFQKTNTTTTTTDTTTFYSTIIFNYFYFDVENSVFVKFLVWFSSMKFMKHIPWFLMISSSSSSLFCPMSMIGHTKHRHIKHIQQKKKKKRPSIHHHYQQWTFSLKKHTTTVLQHCARMCLYTELIHIYNG